MELGIGGPKAERREVGDQVDVELVGAAAFAHGFLPGGL